MAALLKLLTLSLLLCLIAHGAAQPCTVSDIKVHQAMTGKLVKGQPEYRVVISNECVCSQWELRLSCPGGLNTVEPVDPKILAVEPGGTCLVNDGMYVNQGFPIKFKYAWQTPANLLPMSSFIACS